MQPLRRPGEGDIDAAAGAQQRPPGAPATPAAAGAADPAYSIGPVHVVLMGTGALVSGALITATLAYKRSEKQLIAEGIDPRVRRIILPHALRALAASLFTTGCVAGAGFYALRSAGLLASDKAPMPPPREALRMVLWGGAAAPGAQAREAAAAGGGRGEEGEEEGGARAATLPRAGGG